MIKVNPLAGSVDELDTGPGNAVAEDLVIRRRRVGPEEASIRRKQTHHRRNQEARSASLAGKAVTSARPATRTKASLESRR